MHKQALLVALSYPRLHIGNNVRKRGCPFDNNYCQDKDTCGLCLYQEECQWLGVNGDDSDLSSKSVAELLRALAFAVHYVDADVAFWSHDSRSCSCEACCWLRDTQQELQSSTSSYH